MGRDNGSTVGDCMTLAAELSSACCIYLLYTIIEKLYGRYMNYKALIVGYPMLLKMTTNIKLYMSQCLDDSKLGSTSNFSHTPCAIWPHLDTMLSR